MKGKLFRKELVKISKAFISHSHKDNDIAEKIGRNLMKNGIDTWYDEWEIKPGDSIIKKIYDEGLSNTKNFIVLISNNSVNSKWVKDELEIATIKRINKESRIIPLIVDECDIPQSISHIKYISLKDDLDKGIEQLIETILDVSKKPPLGDKPDISGEKINNGLSNDANNVALKIIKDTIEEEKNYNFNELKEMFPNMTKEDLEDALIELKNYNLLKIISTRISKYELITPLYSLYLFFEKYYIGYLPSADICRVLNVLNEKKSIVNKELFEKLKISIGRLNRAVNYIKNFNLAYVGRNRSSRPFSFSEIGFKNETRIYLKNECR